MKKNNFEKPKTFIFLMLGFLLNTGIYIVYSSTHRTSTRGYDSTKTTSEQNTMYVLNKLTLYKYAHIDTYRILARIRYVWCRLNLQRRF